jgi:hypothetical protein
MGATFVVGEETIPKLFVQDGLSAQRLPDGKVVLYVADPQYMTIIEPNIWGSVVASMSSGGESDYGWYNAMALHMGTKLDKSVITQTAPCRFCGAPHAH